MRKPVDSREARPARGPLREKRDGLPPRLGCAALVLCALFALPPAVASAPPAAAAAPPTAGLVGHWTFDDGTGRDVRGAGPAFVLGGARIHPLGPGRACLRLDGAEARAEIPVPAGSPLAIARGTICLWLNLGPAPTGPVLEYDNRAVQLQVYRSHFQPRFRGEGEFRFANAMLGDDWPKFLLRESAFYPHERAVAGEGEWHHFAVAYDDRARTITGWRDGELISVVDLSTVAMEPLLRTGLKSIRTGEGFAGMLDELRIYDRPLDAAEVARIHAAERAAFAGRRDAIASPRRLRVYSYDEGDRSLYRAWLQSRPAAVAGGRELLAQLEAEGADPTVRNAARELAAALGEMTGPAMIAETPLAGPRVVLGTPATSAWVRDHAGELGLAAVRDDGFVLKSTRDRAGAAVLAVAAHQPAGVVFGVFELLRRVQRGADLTRLDLVENPAVPIRLVNHWDLWRGFPHDDWRGGDDDSDDGEGNRTNSIFSWDELRRGDTRRIRDWARLLASAGWNALCPTEINWEPRNNFLAHLDEVKVLAGILREYGIRLYWSPNYLLALRRDTADRLYAVVPDFGGYLLKLGSEAQEGDPRPAMVNTIADHLRPHGGKALVRAFVYGKYRYSADDIRSLNPYEVIGREDGNYRDNVVVVSKGSPLDWDLSAPIPALDGAIRKNLYGTELVIAKSWPLAWVEKWKWWLEQDNRRAGPGTLNKFDLHCLLGVAMIHPAPAWTACPLNMVNYYGLGRLGWNPDLTVEEIYAEWARLTFGDDPAVGDAVRTILRLSDHATRQLYTYRGYRGVWIDLRDQADLVQNKTPHTLTPEGIGPVSPAMRERVLAQYAPGLRARYGDPGRGEEHFATFHFLPLDHRLSSGRTVIQDLYANLDDAVRLAGQMVARWEALRGRVDARRFQFTLDSLRDWVRTAEAQRAATIRGLERVTRRSRDAAVAGLAPEQRPLSRHFNVRDFGARGDGTGDDGSALNAALAAAHAAGGGTVFVPAGVYPAGSIRLQSRVTLMLDTGAVLRARVGALNPSEPNPPDRGPPAPAHDHAPASWLWGENLQDVKILGPGTLDGAALSRSGKGPAESGGNAIALRRCRNVEIRNLTIEQGGHAAILARECDALLIDHVSIATARAGVDLKQCRNVTVTDCRIDTVRREDGRPAGGDDAIKIGSDLSLGEARPSENITVRDSYLAAGGNGVQVGSETEGSFRNLRCENLRIGAAGKAGLSVTGNDGSVIEGVTFRDIAMANTLAPIVVKISAGARVPADTHRRGAIRGLHFENLTATGGGSATRGGEVPSVIWGKPGSPIERVTFRNIRLTVQGGRPAAEGEAVATENDGRFPRDLGALPAYGFVLRHVRDVTFAGCVIGFKRDDGRPALVAEAAEGVVLEDCDLQRGSGRETAVETRGGADVRLLPRGERR